MISNLSITGGVVLLAVIVGELSHSLWWGLVPIALLLIFVGYVNAPVTGGGGPASAEVKQERRR